MGRSNQEQGSGAGPAAPRLALAAFGKHPGWDDHLPGIGVNTEGLADAKQMIYVSGIGGQIDSGVWEKLEPGKRLEGYDHSFVWTRPGSLICGLMWSSKDGRGRAKYPMVLCVEGFGMAPGAAVAAASSELERLRGVCQQAATAEAVTEACRTSQAALDELAAQARTAERFLISPELKRAFLNHPELGPNRVGLLRVLHEIERGLGTPGQGASKNAGASFHLRVPLCGETEAGGQLLWLQFLRCVLPSDLSILLLARTGSGFLDVVLGEPAGGELFCLQASPIALPLATQIPYDVEPELKIRLSKAEANFMGDESQPTRMAKPAAGVSNAASRVRPGDTSASGESRSGLKWLFIAAVVLILIGIGAFVLLRKAETGRQPEQTETPPPRPSAAIPPVATPTQAVQQAVQQEEEDLQASLEAAQTALNQNDPERAIQMAERALVLQPRNPVAATLKSNATALVESTAEKERNYQAAMAAGQKAFSAREWRSALDQAQTALALKAGDSAATKLKSDAQAQLEGAAAAAERDSRYQAAMAAAQKAFGNRDWQGALNQAGAALSLKPNDAAATKLKSDAENQMAAAAATAQKERIYQAAMEAGQAAFAKGEWQAALDQANVALAQKPGVAAAEQLKASAQARIIETTDLVQAETQLARGNYAGVVDLCDKHATGEAFQKLRKQADEEQSALDAARQQLAAGDYAFVAELQSRSYASKAPFQQVISAAKSETAALAELQAMKDQGNWRGVLDRLGAMDKATVAKPPFARLKDWSDDAPAELAQLASTDSSVSDLCVELSFAAHNLKMNERRARTLLLEATLVEALSPAGGQVREAAA